MECIPSDRPGPTDREDDYAKIFSRVDLMEETRSLRQKVSHQREGYRALEAKLDAYVTTHAQADEKRHQQAFRYGYLKARRTHA